MKVKVIIRHLNVLLKNKTNVKTTEEKYSIAGVR